MGQGLEARFIGNLAHTRIGIQQQIFRLLNPDPRQVIRKMQSRGLFEHFAKVECARVDRLGHGAQGNIVGLVVLDELLGARDGGRLGLLGRSAGRPELWRSAARALVPEGI